MDFAAEGLLDDIEDPQLRGERIALLERLLADGVELDELRRAVAEERLALVGVERALGTPIYTPREVADAVGIDVEMAIRYRQALGLPRPDPDERVLTESDLEAAQRLMAFQTAGIPPDGILEVSRVLGEGLSRVAATLRPLVRETFLRPGDSELELSDRYVSATRELGPLLGPVMQHILNMHLRDQLRSEAVGQAELLHGPMRGAVEMSIAFADLVGFTKLGERVPAEELGAIAGQLATLTSEVLRDDVRLVKTIGDAAMLVSPDPGPLLDVTLDLVAAADSQGESFPRLRAGIATGAALGRQGDWFGAPVNLASRITDIARAGTVVASAPTREVAGDSHWRWSALPSRRLKGVDHPVPLFRARRVDEAVPVGR